MWGDDGDAVVIRQDDISRMDRHTAAADGVIQLAGAIAVRGAGNHGGGEHRLAVGAELLHIPDGAIHDQAADAFAESGPGQDRKSVV